ncbi:MAG TPA: hypothetical protein VEP66_00760, partial [Myxococcales bacterium]|nr:hypothetical protein [Myxococcales bacterium]
MSDCLFCRIVAGEVPSAELPPTGGRAPVSSTVLPVLSAPVASSGVLGTSVGAQSTISPGRAYRIPWAELLKKVFAVDVLSCPVCSGRMKLIAYIASSSVARRILEHLGLPTTGPP